jgi:hypothetical protein
MKGFLTNVYKGLSGLVHAVQVNLAAGVSKIAGKKVVIFQLHAANQIPHILSVIERLNATPLCTKFDCTVMVLPNEMTAARKEFSKRNLKAHISSYYAAQFSLGWDVIVAIDQRMRLPYLNILKGRRLCMFHGQPTKGNVYSGFNHQQIDDLFFYGPLMREYYFAEKKKHFEWPDVQTWDIGQPKSDELINVQTHRADALELLNLDVGRKTVVYAPSFENCASMVEHGEEIIAALAVAEYNLIIKPHPAFYRVVNPDDAYFLGVAHAEEWRRRADAMRKNGNVVFEIDKQVDARLALGAADVLITDHSGIAFDAILLDKPVIYFDCPRFFGEYLPARFGVDGDNARNDVACNAGRAAGVVVRDVAEMLRAVDEYLAEPQLHAAERQEIRDILLFNQGCATDVFVRKLIEITE